MGKSELVNNQLIPLVLIAGVLSGSLLRTSPPVAGKGTDANTNTEKLDGAVAAVPWVSDLRPVMDTMDAAMGAESATVDASSLPDAAGISLEAKGEARDKRVLEAMTALVPASTALLLGRGQPPAVTPEDCRVRPTSSLLDPHR